MKKTIQNFIIFYICSSFFVCLSTETKCWSYDQFEQKSPFLYFPSYLDQNILFLSLTDHTSQTSCSESTNIRTSISVYNGEDFEMTLDEDIEMTLQIAVFHPTVPTNLDNTEPDFSSCESSHTLFSIGVKDGNSEEFHHQEDEYAFNNDYFASSVDDSDFPSCSSESQDSSTFPDRIDSNSMNSLYIKFTASGIPEGKISSIFGGTLSIHFSEINGGSLRLRVSILDNTNTNDNMYNETWVELGIREYSTIDSVDSLEFNFTVPDGILSRGCHANTFHLDFSGTKEEEEEETTTAFFDFIEYRIREIEQQQEEENNDMVTTELFKNDRFLFEDIIHSTDVLWRLQNSFFSVCVSSSSILTEVDEIGTLSCDGDDDDSSSSIAVSENSIGVILSTKIPGTNDYSQNIAIYSDGRIQMKPQPPTNENENSSILFVDTPFGSSFVLGQSLSHPISSLHIVLSQLQPNEEEVMETELLESLVIRYDDNQIIKMNVLSIDREKMIIHAISSPSFFLLFGNDDDDNNNNNNNNQQTTTTTTTGFLQFQSMFVSEGNSDCDSILYDNGLATYSSSISSPMNLDQFNNNNIMIEKTKRIAFVRRCESRHNSRSPELAVLLGISPSGSNGTIKSCDILCENDGVCKMNESVLFVNNTIRRRRRTTTTTEEEEEQELYYCECVDGYFGTNCENFTCEPPCENMGVCVSPDQCDCSGTDGYLGDRCDFKPCFIHCYNDGFCDTRFGACQCSPGFTGMDCSSFECSSECNPPTYCGGPETCLIDEDTYKDQSECHKFCLDYSDCPMKAPRCTSNSRCARCETDGDCSKHAEDVDHFRISLVCDSKTGKCKRCFPETSFVYVVSSFVKNDDDEVHEGQLQFVVNKTMIRDLRIGDFIYSWKDGQKNDHHQQQLEIVEVFDILKHLTPDIFMKIRYFDPILRSYETLSISPNHMLYYDDLRVGDGYKNIESLINDIISSGPKPADEIKMGDYLIIMTMTSSNTNEEGNYNNGHRFRGTIGRVVGLEIEVEEVKLVNIFTRNYKMFVDGVLVTGYGKGYGKWPMFMYIHGVSFLRRFFGWVSSPGGWLENRVVKKLFINDI